MTTTLAADTARQITPPEDRHATELAFLAAYDDGPRPPAWRLTPRAVVTFVMGSDGRALRLPDDAPTPEGVPRRLVVEGKFVGDRA
ncbi:AAA family ATPase, partial [Streptomyces sp. NPDC058656]